MTTKVQLQESLVAILKGLGAKTNWLEVNRQSQSNFDFDFLVESVESSSSEKWETGSWGQGELENLHERERPPLEAATKQRLVRTEKTVCAIVTVIFEVCNSVRLS
jgi:hypothetical protein